MTSLQFPRSLDHDAFQLALEISESMDKNFVLLNQFQDLITQGARIDAPFNLSYMVRGSASVAFPITTLEIMLSVWPAEHRSACMKHLGDISDLTFPNMSECFHVLNKSNLDNDVIFDSKSTGIETFSKLLKMSQLVVGEVYQQALLKIDVWQLIADQRFGPNCHGFEDATQNGDKRIKTMVEQHRLLTPSSDPVLLHDITTRVSRGRERMGPNLIIYLAVGVDEHLRSSEDYKMIMDRLCPEERAMVERLVISNHVTVDGVARRASKI